MHYGDNKDITYFAESDFRNKKTPFGIKSLDRARHIYVIGKTGMGKSTALENMAVQDIQNGNGIGFIDPHGGSAELLLEYVPKERINDVIYFAPHETDWPMSFNVMEDVGKDQRHLVANGLMSAFKKIWPDVWSARMEYISTNIILALLEYPDSTLMGINRMLSDKAYRNMVVAHLTDPVVRSFWVDEFAKYSDKLMVEASSSIQNKFGQFVSNPIIRNIVGQPKSSFDMREVMDSKKIIIMNLSKGRMGELNANLIGGMLITKIYLAAMSRASATNLKQLPPFYLYVDEFQSFVNESFKDILSEARKYKLSLTIAHQYIEQVPEEVRDAVFGNVGTTIAFRVGPFDAELLEKVFGPKFMATDLVNLGFAQIYLTLMINGVGSPPFSAKTLPPIQKPDISFKKEVIEASQHNYATPRDIVEENIKKWYTTAVDDPGIGGGVVGGDRAGGGDFRGGDRGGRGGGDFRAPRDGGDRGGGSPFPRREGSGDRGGGGDFRGPRGGDDHGSRGGDFRSPRSEQSGSFGSSASRPPFNDSPRPQVSTPVSPARPFGAPSKEVRPVFKEAFAAAVAEAAGEAPTAIRNDNVQTIDDARRMEGALAGQIRQTPRPVVASVLALRRTAGPTDPANKERMSLNSLDRGVNSSAPRPGLDNKSTGKHAADLKDTIALALKKKAEDKAKAAAAPVARPSPAAIVRAAPPVAPVVRPSPAAIVRAIPPVAPVSRPEANAQHQAPSHMEDVPRVVKQESPGEPELKVKTPPPPPPPPRNEIPPQSPKSEPKKIREVPEEVLRKVLDTDSKIDRNAIGA